MGGLPCQEARTAPWLHYLGDGHQLLSLSHWRLRERYPASELGRGLRVPQIVGHLLHH
jgi:hypothetical protein